MGKRLPEVDAYIAKSADFAKPILLSIRETVHAACPEVESFAWKGALLESSLQAAESRLIRACWVLKLPAVPV